jgi:hypothetical protein
MTWQINLDKDGVWINKQWHSDRRVDNVPKFWKYSPEETAQLSYASYDEIELIKKTGANRFVGPGGVEFYSNQLPSFIHKQTGEIVTDIPYYWLSAPDHVFACLVYLTPSQIKLLEAADIYGSNIAENPHYGPRGIRSYQGDGGGGGGGSCSAGGTEGCSSSSNTGDSGFGGDGGGTIGGGIPGYFYITGNSGIYSGSLSAQGNMVAMQLNPGPFLFVETETNNIVGNIFTYTGTNTINIQPYLRGCFREYWRDPTQCTFGSNSAMPAITGVMPAEFTNTPGNFNYYCDLQIFRLFGSNGFNQFYFYNILYNAISWVQNSNSYLAGLKNAENNDLGYYGFSSYDDLVTQGFNKYKNSVAIVKSFENLGFLVQTIPLGYFGTSNAVAKSMIDYGLGAVGNLSEKLFNSGIIYQQIGNSNFTAQIDAILQTITNPSDLALIQQVLKTTVPTDFFITPLSYTSIESTSGLANDSQFQNLAELGLDIYLRAPGSNFTNGRQVALLLRAIQNESSPTVEQIADSDSLLTPEIIATLRSFLPVASDNRPITVLDIIGTASGYWASFMKEVNDGLAQLLATPYGPILRTMMEDLSRFAAGIPVSTAEINAAESYTPVPPPETITTYEPESNNTYTTVIKAGGPGYWATRFNSKQQEFFTFLETIVSDPLTAAIAKKINDNYYEACKFLSQEVVNYNKANFDITAYGDNSQVFAFVAGIPELAVDRQNIATDYLLYGVSQDNLNGNLLRTLLAQAKNEAFLSAAGAKITGIV